MKWAKINREKSVGLQLGSRNVCALPGPFSRTDGLYNILGAHRSEVLEKVMAATAHLPQGKYASCTPTFSTSTPLHRQSRKGPVPVYLGQTGSLSGSRDLSASSVETRWQTLRLFPRTDVCMT